MNTQTTIGRSSTRLPYDLKSKFASDYYYREAYSLVLNFPGHLEGRGVIERAAGRLCFDTSSNLWATEMCPQGGRGFIEVGNLPSNGGYSHAFHYLEKGNVVKSFTPKELYWACMRIQKMNNCKNCVSHRNIAGCILTVFPQLPVIPYLNKESLTSAAKSLPYAGVAAFVPPGVFGAFGISPTVHGLMHTNWVERITNKREAPKKIRPSMIAKEVCRRLCYFSGVCPNQNWALGALRCQNRSWQWNNFPVPGPFTEEAVKRAYANFFNELPNKRTAKELTFIAANGGLTTRILGYSMTLRKMDPGLQLVQFITDRGYIRGFKYEDAVKLITLPYRSNGEWLQTGYVTPEKEMEPEKLLVYMGLCREDGWVVKTGSGWGSGRKPIGFVRYDRTMDRAFRVKLAQNYWHSYNIDEPLGINRMVGWWHPMKQGILEDQYRALSRAAQVQAEMDSMKDIPLSQLRKKK